MAKTPSTMLALGTPVPDFTLPDFRGNLVKLSDYSDASGVLVAFICNHCPYVKHIAPELARIGSEYAAKGVAVFAINSNDVQKYPDDAPPRMAEEAASRGYTFPYLLDESQEVAKRFQAACTPDFYVFDRNRKLVYRGQMDGSRPGNNAPVTGKDLRSALDAMLEGRPVSEDQTPSIGCNIKWKPGNEPGYF